MRLGCNIVQRGFTAVERQFSQFQSVLHDCQPGNSNVHYGVEITWLQASTSKERCKKIWFPMLWNSNILVAKVPQNKSFPAPKPKLAGPALYSPLFLNIDALTYRNSCICTVPKIAIGIRSALRWISGFCARRLCWCIFFEGILLFFNCCCQESYWLPFYGIVGRVTELPAQGFQW